MIMVAAAAADLSIAADHPPISGRIVGNLLYPYKFVVDGKKLDNTDVKKFPLVYTCKDSRPPALGNCRPKVGAYTVDPRLSDYGTWTITFYDDFFKTLNFAEKLWDPTVYKNPTPPDLNSRRTYEDAIIHEYFHVSGMGFVPNYVAPTPDAPIIIDVEAEIEGTNQLIYGATLANKFAYKVPKVVNPDVAINADNYALFFLSMYVNRIYRGIWDKETRWNAPDPNGAGLKPRSAMVGNGMVSDFGAEVGNMTVWNNMTIVE